LGDSLLNTHQKKGELMESNKSGFVSIDETLHLSLKKRKKFWKNYGQ